MGIAAPSNPREQRLGRMVDDAYESGWEDAVELCARLVECWPEKSDSIAAIAVKIREQKTYIAEIDATFAKLETKVAV